MTQQLATALVPEWTLGDRLRKAREITGLDAIQLADIIGVHRDTIANYEKGKVRPRRIVLRAWAMATGVSLNWLETGESPRPAGGPNGGLECAIRDSNPEPADSLWQFRHNTVAQLHELARVVPLPHPRHTDFQASAASTAAAA